ncbi:hypothetical protein C0995_016563, partial [Termitomyces sp. Mi166
MTLEAQQMVEATKTPNKGMESSSHNDDPSLAQVLEKRTELLTTNDDPAVAQALTTGTKSPMNREHGEVQMHAHILQEYKKDQMYVAILNKPTEHSRFTIEWKLIYTIMEGAKVLCVPRDRSLIMTILDQAHNIVGHFEYQKTLNYVQVLTTGTKALVNSEHDEVQMHVHILQGYKKDRMCIEILNKPTEHPCFTIEQELIYTINMEGVKVLCVPRDWSLITTILDQAHTIVGHFGYQKMLNY